MKKCLFALPLLIILIQGCVSYQRCKDRFGTSIQDSVTVTRSVTVIVPKDSAVLVVDRQTLLDTIPFKYYVQSPQGARVLLRSTKTPQGLRQIEARADCPEKVITRTVTVKTPPTMNRFGVNPFWKTLAIALLIVLGGVVLYWLIRSGKGLQLLVWLGTGLRRFFGLPV